jgi:hypothetical protein
MRNKPKEKLVLKSVKHKMLGFIIIVKELYEVDQDGSKALVGLVAQNKKGELFDVLLGTLLPVKKKKVKKYLNFYSQAYV